MTDSINLINPFNQEDEEKFKSAYLFLKNEYNTLKKDKLDPLNEEYKSTQNQFHSHIQDYHKYVNLTLDKEKEIEQLYSKISKLKKKQALIMNNNFNDKFYKHLLEIAENPKKEKILKNFFSLILIQENKNQRSIKDLIIMLKDKEEIKNLLKYATKIYYDIRANNEEEYLNLKKNFENYFSEIGNLEIGQYPFDELFGCLKIIFEIIEYEKNIKDNNEILGKLTEKKNAKFVEIKILEQRIKNLKKSKKLIKNNLLIIRSFFDKFNEQNTANLSEKGLKELLINIEEYKKKEKNNQNLSPPLDVITSLTFGTYYTQSEDSSIKSSKISSKNGLNFFISNSLQNNGNNNLDITKIKNPQFNTYDTLFKTVSNTNSNLETNDRNSKKIVNDKPKKVDKNDKNNSINTSKNTDKNINKNKKNLCNDNLKKENIKLRPKEPTVIKNNNKTFDAKSIENIKKNKLIKIEKIIQPNRTITKDSEILNHKNQTIINKNKKKKEEINRRNDNKENSIFTNNNTIEDREIISAKKTPYNFTNLHNLGSKMNQLKHREPDESIEMTIPKEINKLDTINNENLFNDNSVCDEMISMNYDIANKNKRSTTNDYINKIGVKNNIVSKETNHIAMRRNNNTGKFGKLQIEKSIEASTCCVSCT